MMANSKQRNNDLSNELISSSLMDCIDTNRALGVQILPVTISLMGTLVKIQTKEDKWYEGIFKTISPKFDFCLEVAHQFEPGREDELPRQSTVCDKLIFKLEDVVRIEGAPDLESVVKTGFATDSEISRANNGAIEAARELEPWEPDTIGEEEHNLATVNNGPLGDGWSAEAMFEANESRFLYKSDYDERLYHTADVHFDPENDIDQERARRAEEIAREIERNPASKRAAELENDDEERDIIPRSSGSSANNSAVTTPTSTTASGAPNRYVPPNKRTGGGDRGARNPRRGGGGDRGSGAPFQSARNQQGGDSRVPQRPGRDYGDSGGYPIGTSYYGQRPHRFTPQHHQIVAQTSHERSPTGPGSASNNEWERARGPKRQDIRENYGGPPPVPPPQVPSATQASRPPPSGPARQNADGSSGNGRGRKMDEFKSFSMNFQLASPEQATGSQGPSHMNPPAISTAGSSSMQAQRLPTQSSPIQPQLPPQTTSMPPAQQHQRRSPDLKNQPMTNYAHKTGPPSGHHPHQQQHHPNQNQSKMHPQISPVQTQPPSIPPPMIRTDVPPRMMAANEAMYQQQQMQQLQQQHQPPLDFTGSQHGHHQQQPRPGHPPSTMVIPNAQSGNGGPPSHAPKMQQIPPGHVPQLQTVISQPPPPSFSQPPPTQTPQQQQNMTQPPPSHQPPIQPQQQQNADHEQRGNEPDAIKKSKLNPEAAEFRPQFLRQGSASTPTAPPMATMVPNPAVVGNYPVPVQSPPSTPMMAQTPVQSAAGYSGVSVGATVPSQTIYLNAAPNAYQQLPHSTSGMTMQLGNGGNNQVHLYPMRTTQPVSATYISYPRAAIAGPPQPAVAAATGQPIMAAPYAPTGPYVLYNAPNVQAAQPHPGGQAGAAYSQNTYIMNPPRMFAPQYVLPQNPASGEHAQQSYYAVSPVVQMGPGAYPQAASVPMSMAQTMHQSAPASQYNQQQNNGNNNPSQTPPTSQQQSTNPSPATGPPPNTVSGNVPMNTPVIAYPPSAPTPQSPQYPTAPGASTGAYPAGGVQYILVQPNFGAPQLYNGQGGLATGQVQVHPAQAMHQGYQAAAQQHFVPDIAQSHFASVAAAQQAAVAQHVHHVAYHPNMNVLRSASVPAFPPGGPTVSIASGQGAPISHQNNHG